VNSPTPAIVTQKAVRPLPRWALLLLCLAYVVPGFVGRAPWKNADVAAFGYMLELANGHTAWLRPLLGGIPPETDGLLPYWLGAWAIQITPDWLMAPEIGGAPAVHGAAGADAGNHLVRCLLPGAQSGCPARGICVWRRGQALRLRPCHRRWRLAGPDCLPGPGAAVA